MQPSKHSQHSYSILKAITVESKLIGLQTPVEELIEINYLRTGELSLPADCYRRSWLRIDEFVKNYDFVDICNMSPDQMGQPLTDEYDWQLSCIEGSWVSGLTAGGSTDDLKSFWTNPQYVMQLAQPDAIDGSGLCHLVISLMQKHRTAGYHPVSFVVYQITEEDFRTKSIPMSFSKRKLPKVIAHPIFSGQHEVTSRVKVAPSTLLIVPCTQKRNTEGEFLLRIYSRPNRKTCESNTSAVMGANWPSMVRMFYSLANSKGMIDHIALASILNKHFFTSKSKSSRTSSFWKSLTRRRTHQQEKSTSTNGPHQESIEQLAQILISPGKTTETSAERLNYDRFKRIIRDVQRWKEVFDLYDPDRKGFVDRKKLIKSLKTSVSEGHQQQHSMSGLLQWLEMEQEDKISLEEFVYYSQQSPQIMQCELQAQINSVIFEKMAPVEPVILDKKT